MAPSPSGMTSSTTTWRWMPNVPALVQLHVGRLVGQVGEGLAEALAHSTTAALESLGIEVVVRTPRDSGGRCSVDASYSEGPPPRITIARSASKARMRFSALHEFCHHLVRHDLEVHDDFALQPDAGTSMEESMADALAAELLLPISLVDSHIDRTGPTAASIVSLYRAGQASREATCVRASQRLLGSGYVMLAEEDVARFTAGVGHPYRVARGTHQGEDSIVAKAAARGHAREESRVVFASGNVGELLFADAVEDDGYVFCVFTDRPGWEKLTWRNKNDLFTGREGSCPNCDFDFEFGKGRCPNCREPNCPRCGGCWCGVDQGPRRQKACTACHLLWGPDRFRPGSEVCLDCE